MDTSVVAVAAARREAVERAVPVRFEVRDARDLVSMAQQFDPVIDCGLFHVLDDDDRATYVRGLGDVAVRGGRYVMMCFSDRQPGFAGPRRVAQSEIRACFGTGWRIDSIDAVTMELTTNPAGVRAWLCRITRL